MRGGRAAHIGYQGDGLGTAAGGVGVRHTTITSKPAANERMYEHIYIYRVPGR